MMRELKASLLRASFACRDCCSPNPYDEGTESCPFLTDSNFVFVAAAQIPMMRELKGDRCDLRRIASLAAAQIPMMRELKALTHERARLTKIRCSPNPYDEGTESLTGANTSQFLETGCSPNPYDEGTESMLKANLFPLSGWLQPKSL